MFYGSLVLFKMGWLGAYPGIAIWIEIIELWASRQDLKPLQRLIILTVGSELGSDWAKETVLSIENMSTSDWLDDDKMGHMLSRALYELRRRKSLFPLTLIEKILYSKCFNVATHGIHALSRLNDQTALQRLINYHRSASHWHLKDTAANTLESMAGQLGVSLDMDGDGYCVANINDTSTVA